MRMFTLILTLCGLLASTAIQAQTGTITGQITDGQTGQPMSGVEVQIGIGIFGGFDLIETTSTDSEGRYTFEVPGGSGRLIFINPAPPHRPIYWPDIVCIGLPCSPGMLPNISAAAGQTVVADAQVFRPGNLSGRVVRSEDQAPMAGVKITAAALNNPFASLELHSNADGEYFFPMLSAGTFRIFAEAGPGFVSEVFDNVPCTFCFGFQAGETPVIISSDLTATGIDFALDRAALISGTVEDDVAGGLQAGVGVTLHRRGKDGFETVTGVLVEGGQFEFNGLLAGDYVLATYSSGSGPTYVNEVFEELACQGPDCSENEIALGTTLSLGPGESATASFSLEPAASISGCLTSAGSGQPLANVEVIAYYIDLFGQFPATVNSTHTGPDGCYRLDYLPARNLRLRTFNTQGLVDRIYPDLPCLGNACPVDSGQEIPVPHNADLSGFDLQLATGASISGQILLRVSGPVADGELRLYDGAGDPIRFNDPFALPLQSNGDFQTYGLPDGTYYLAVNRGVDYYVFGAPTLPGDPRPEPTDGTPIVISAGQSVPGLVWILDEDGLLLDGFEN